MSEPAPKNSLDRSRIKVVLLEGVHPRAVEAFAADGYTNVERHAKALADDDLVRSVRDAHLVGIRSRTRLSEKVLEEASRLIAVGCFCIGTDQVDLRAAEARGIPVFNAPFSNTRSVAELVLAEIILLLRGIPEKNAQVHRGVWSKSASGAHEARGKTVGIVGYGHIGTQVGLLAESVGMRVLFYDIVAKLALGNAHAVRSLDALLEQSDVVTFHVPETPATRGMLDAGRIARLPRGAKVVNASRGSVVHDEALAAALASGQVGGAAIDVFPREPESNDEPFVSPLRGLDNVLLTPHVGGSTEEAQENIGVEVADKLIRYSNNGSTLSSVNFPEVSLPGHAGQHRVLHIHRNQPGVLSRINDVFSRRGINVAAQYLQTSARIGYVVIDVESGEVAETRALKTELDAVDGTIRTRVLY